LEGFKDFTDFGKIEICGYKRNGGKINANCRLEQAV